MLRDFQVHVDQFYNSKRKEIFKFVHKLQVPMEHNLLTIKFTHSSSAYYNNMNINK